MKKNQTRFSGLSKVIAIFATGALMLTMMIGNVPSRAFADDSTATDTPVVVTPVIAPIIPDTIDSTTTDPITDILPPIIDVAPPAGDSTTSSTTNASTTTVVSPVPSVVPDARIKDSAQTCHFISSDTTESGIDGNDAPPGSVIVSPINTAWTATTSSPNAKWIWGDVLTDAEAQNGSTYTFTKHFWVTGATPVGSLQVAADNGYIVNVNGTQVTDQSGVENNFTTAATYDVSAYLLSGQVNVITITVNNLPVSGSTALSNPAGVLFDLKVGGDACSGVSKVYIHKFIQTGSGDTATSSAVGDKSTFPDFPMTATWTAPNLNGGIQSSGTYPLGEYFGGAAHKFNARTAYMAHLYDYTSSEITGGDSPVVASQDSCSPGKFYLVGYKSGKDMESAKDAPLSQTAPEFVNQSSHNDEIVINAKCPATPKECTVVSDTGTLVNDGQGTGHQPAVLVSQPFNAAWTAVVADASWIWGQDPITQHDTVKGKTEVFTKTFSLSDAPTSTSTLTIAADNDFAVTINGTLLASTTNGDNYSASTNIDVPAGILVKGSNKMVVSVTNLAMANGNPQTNPAGLIYSLTTNGADCKVGGGGNGGGKTGTLTIIKNTTNGDGDFVFPVDPQVQTEVAQTPTQNVDITTVGGTGSSTVSLTPGDYNVTETIPDGWTLNSSSCVYSSGDEVGNSITNGEAITVDAGDSVTCTFSNTKNTVPDGGGGNGGGSTGGSTGGGVSGGTISGGGHVLGASIGPVTPQGQVLGASCGPILFTYLRQGKTNDASQVKVLQNFLNTDLGTSLPVTGFFGTATTNAVDAFQQKYFTDVLTPWVPYGLKSPHDPTGYVYKTTKTKINNLACSELNLPLPALP